MLDKQCLDKFCIECELSLQKAVFNNKFLRYGKKFKESLFLCVLCLTGGSLDLNNLTNRITKWDSKASRFPNLFVALSLLEMRKHCESLHPNFSPISTYVNLITSINKISWHAASLRWDEKNSSDVKIAKLQKKKARELAEWSLKEFGYDYTKKMKKNVDESVLISTSSELRTGFGSFLKPKVLRELTTLEKSMELDTFLLHAYKNIPQFYNESLTARENIASMPFDEFIVYSATNRHQMHCKHERRHTEILMPLERKSLIYDDFEDLNDSITYSSSHIVRSSSQHGASTVITKLADDNDNTGDPHSVTSGDPHSVTSGDPHSVTSGNPHSVTSGDPHSVTSGDPHSVTSGDPHSVTSGDPHSVTSESIDHQSLSTGRKNSNVNNHFVRSSDATVNNCSLPDLCDCPLDPDYIDLRAEWGEAPTQIFYSPPIISKLSSLQTLKDSINSLQETDAGRALKQLNANYPNFVDFTISLQYQNYNILFCAVSEFNERKVMELSLCENRTKRQILMKGNLYDVVFCL
jgi:hypothetical protein